MAGWKESKELPLPTACLTVGRAGRRRHCLAPLSAGLAIREDPVLTAPRTKFWNVGDEGVEPSTSPHLFILGVVGIEPTTSILSEWRSTTELHTHKKWGGFSTAELVAQNFGTGSHTPVFSFMKYFNRCKT